MNLQESRERIDKIDKKIVELFEQRMEIAKEVAAYKIHTGKQVFDKERELQKLENVKQLTHNEFNQIGVNELFTQIMSISRKLQYSLIQSEKDEILFEKVKHLKIKDKKIVCFGANASYTEQAMEECFGTDIDYFHAMSFKEVMEALKTNKAQYGVLPIENSSTGGITDSYDLLMEYNNYIIGEHVIKVEQALLGLPGSKVEDLKKVYSHPQGIMQCAKFLEKHPYIKTEEFTSTAGSAKKVLEDNDNSQGAIASVRAAAYYGLEVLQENISFESNNSTRFIIISNQKCFFEDANKVSICFELPHESGTLYNMLSHFIYNHLNMTKIESRPIPGKTWEYRFFVEFEGNLMNPGVRNALRGIKEESSSFKILGNFKTQ